MKYQGMRKGIVFIVLVMLLSTCNSKNHNERYLGKALFINNNNSQLIEKRGTYYNEVILMYTDSTATVLSTDFGSYNTGRYVEDNTSILLLDERLKKLNETENRIDLAGKDNFQISYSKFYFDQSQNYNHQSQYVVEFDDWSINIGSSIDSSRPNRLPYEMKNSVSRDKLYGFTNINNIGKYDEILHSDLFTLIKSPIDDSYCGYILDSLFEGGVRIKENDTKKDYYFRELKLVESNFVNERLISKDLFLSEELPFSGMGMGGIPSNNSSLSIIDQQISTYPTIEISQNGTIRFYFGDHLLEEYSVSVINKYGNILYLIGDKFSKTLELSDNLDTISTYNSYYFDEGDGSYISFNRQDTYVRN